MLLLPNAAVLPSAYRLAGSVALENPSTASFVEWNGLPVGDYSITPQFEGGLSGSPISVTVASGQSAVVSLSVPDVGRTEIAGPSAGCSDAAVLRLSTRVNNGGAGDSRPHRPTRHFGYPDVATCHWSVAGLVPGDYRANLVGPGGVVGYQVFHVTSQLTTAAILQVGQVLVNGRVMSGGKPAPDLGVLYRQVDGGTSFQARTDPNGNYRLSLSEPGRYVVAFDLIRGTTSYIDNRQNTVDWTIAEADEHRTGGISACRTHRFRR